MKIEYRYYRQQIIYGIDISEWQKYREKVKHAK